MLKRLILWFRNVLFVFSIVRQNQSNRQVASTWDSALLAASEELLDENDLGVTIYLPLGVTYDAVVSFILDASRNKPDYCAISNSLTRDYGLTMDDALRAIDRTLGGVVRAASQQSQYCPDSVRDPIAWSSFQKAFKDHSIVDDIYGGWTLPVLRQNKEK